MLSKRHFLYNHARLTIAISAGVALAMFSPVSWAAATRILAGWNLTAWLYLGLMAWLMMRASQDRVRQVAEQEDESWVVVLPILSIASIVSLAAIFLELSAVKDLSASLRLFRYAFTGTTVLGSWLLLGTLFTHHYARLFYRSPAERRPLRFPELKEAPNYWDFLYFSFTIAVAVQTSDVAVMTSGARKAVLVQSVISFFFNVAIVGLSINIAASLIGS